jgi:hypothetical protein
MKFIPQYLFGLLLIVLSPLILVLLILIIPWLIVEGLNSELELRETLCQLRKNHL